VHSDNSFFSLVIGDKVVRGTTDIVLVPKRSPKGDLAEYCMVLFEYKPVENLQLDAYTNQAKLKFLAASIMSKFPVIFIITNLVNKAFGYKLKMENGKYYLVEIDFDSLPAMADYIAEYIKIEGGPMNYVTTFLPDDSNNEDIKTAVQFKRQKVFDLNDADEFQKFQDIVEDPDLPSYLKCHHCRTRTIFDIECNSLSV
jgi:hypothetical protein